MKMFVVPRHHLFMDVVEYVLGSVEGIEARVYGVCYKIYVGIIGIIMI